MPSRRWVAMGVLVTASALGPHVMEAQDAAPVSEEAAFELIEAAASRYRDVSALCADFTQHLLVPLLGEERTGTGRLCQAQPNRFGMRFSDPEGDLVVADGSFVWLYYPSLDPKQVFKLPMAGGPGGYDFHREFLEEPARKYEVTYQAEDDVGGHPTHRLRLVPLEPASYEAAVVWIDRGTPPLLRQIRIEEENGSVRTVTLEQIDLEPVALSDDWFSFTPPEGSHVISR